MPAHDGTPPKPAEINRARETWACVANVVVAAEKLGHFLLPLGQPLQSDPDHDDRETNRLEGGSSRERARYDEFVAFELRLFCRASVSL